jgi:tetratricopeptide (TPR) repeat protein
LREEVYRQLATDQRAAFALLEKRAPGALAAIDANLAKNNQAIASFPGDPTFLVLKGYTLKDAYQNSKGLMPLPKRRVWLAEARRSFEQALQLAPKDASANNGLGNVLFFEGSFDAALHQHELALKLRGGNYSEAASDKELVLSVKRGERPFDF